MSEVADTIPHQNISVLLKLQALFIVTTFFWQYFISRYLRQVFIKRCFVEGVDIQGYEIYRLTDMYQHFVEASCLHFQGRLCWTRYNQYNFEVMFTCSWSYRRKLC
jgi:hypothetical protein